MKVYCKVVQFLIYCISRTEKSDYNLRYVSPSVRLSAWNNSAPTGRTFIKFDIRAFFSKICKENSNFIKIWQ